MKGSQSFIAPWSRSWILSLLASALIWTSLASPLRYEHRRTLHPLSIHIAQFDPTHFVPFVERANNEGLGRETVSSMAKRARAVLGVNGGFFKMGGTFDGDPAGVLKIRDRWFSEPSLPRAAIGWTDLGRDVLIGRLQMEWQVTLAEDVFLVAGINRQRAANEVILFTPDFNSTTLTASGGIELSVDSAGIVRDTSLAGNTRIPPDGWVVSFGSTFDAPQGDLKGVRVSVSYRFVSVSGEHLTSSDWDRMDYILGGTPLLLRDGRKVGDFEAEKVQESFVEGRHPRTAVGVLDNGTWTFVVVDGRRPDFSVGMSLRELADLMQSLGCVVALNLDGGGSSTFYIYGQVVNMPSDLTGERAVSDAILVRPR